MPRTPVPSATGEHPCAADHPRTPLFPALFAFAGTPSVTPEPFRLLLLAWFTPSPSPVGRSTIRAMRCSSGTRTNSAGRQCPGRRYGLPPACASTSWTCRRRRGTRRCGTWGPGLRWRFTEGTARVGSGCGSWWPRGARTSCRGCSTGWSGAPSRWISGRSVRAGASRLHRHLLFDRRECPRIHRVRVVHGGPVRKRPVHRGPLSGCGPPSLAARSNPRCRHCRRFRRCRHGRPWGALGAPPTSYDSSTRWRRNATGYGCGARALSRWPSRRPHEWSRELGHGH